MTIDMFLNIGALGCDTELHREWFDRLNARRDDQAAKAEICYIPMEAR